MAVEWMPARAKLARPMVYRAMFYTELYDFVNVLSAFDDGEMATYLSNMPQDDTALPKWMHGIHVATNII